MEPEETTDEAAVAEARRHAALAQLTQWGDPILRARASEVTAFDGEPITLDAEGPDAVVLQHELDHLDGLLMLDRADRDERRRAMRLLRERVARG